MKSDDCRKANKVYHQTKDVTDHAFSIVISQFRNDYVNHKSDKKKYYRSDDDCIRNIIKFMIKMQVETHSMDSHRKFYASLDHSSNISENEILLKNCIQDNTRSKLSSHH